MPDWNCTKFEDHLLGAVENHNSPGDAFDEESDAESAVWRELRAHANACPDCRKLWNEFAILDRVLPVWKDQLPQVNLADAVLARWREEQSAIHPASAAASPDKSATRHKPAGRSFFALATVLAVAGLIGLSFLFVPPTDEDLPATQPVSTTNNEPAAEKTDGPKTIENDESADWQTLARNAGSAYRVLADDAADSFASAMVFVPPPQPAVESAKPIIKPQPSKGWVEEIETGFKPIGHDVGQAMGFLFEALPNDPPSL